MRLPQALIVWALETAAQAIARLVLNLARRGLIDRALARRGLASAAACNRLSLRLLRRPRLSRGRAATLPLHR